MKITYKDPDYTTFGYYEPLGSTLEDIAEKLDEDRRKAMEQADPYVPEKPEPEIPKLGTSGSIIPKLAIAAGIVWFFFLRK